MRKTVSCLFVSFVILSLPLSARMLQFGTGVELGYEEHITTEEGTSDDGYSTIDFTVALDHPVLLWDGNLSLNPTVMIGYTDYFEVNELDDFTFEISSPILLEFDMAGGERDSLQIDLNLSRDIEAVSTTTDERAASTTIGLGATYTRNLARARRWKTELGYTYDRDFYDDSEYRDLESDIHTFSAALLYAMREDIDLGLRYSYALEIFDQDENSDSQTSELTALGRWNVTGKTAASLELGYHTTSYDSDEEDDDGATARLSVDWQPSPRWGFLAAARHELDLATEGEDERLTVTEGSLTVSYQVSPRFRVGVTPGVSSEDGETRVTEYSLEVVAGYDFKVFDLELTAGITDRRSDDDGDDDNEYTAANAAIRATFEF